MEKLVAGHLRDFFANVIRTKSLVTKSTTKAPCFGFLTTSRERSARFFNRSSTSRFGHSARIRRGRSVDTPFSRVTPLRATVGSGTMLGPGQPALPPMPPEDQLTTMFDQVLKQMDLPVDKMRILKEYNNEKKWKVVVDSV
ncbi:unnamed protein product [Angiostrongylus costaricensis]|uniref:Drf_GBD domain-containing protein n=1 Tax=Angiostrongylus costaricensis TaxID=334426 RepID=A0A158PDN5_ANGCS|nr:unnamed protein product [Angiostrongylus costaricensis]